MSRPNWNLTLPTPPDILFATFFEDSAAEILFTQNTGTGAAQVRDVAISEFGIASYKMTHGNVAGNTTKAVRGVPGNFGGRFGFEIGFRPQADGQRVHILIATVWPSGNKGSFGARLTFSGSPGSTIVEYLNSGGTFTAITGSPIYNLFGAINDAFHEIKLVCDDTTDGSPVYSYLEIDDIRYPLDGIAGQVASDTEGPRIEAQITLESTGAASKSSNIGHWIMTYNEP